ncbi:acetyl esterase/lipase [Glaciihabitans tibetensis]|uniref:Acetyl esterase/lipase n=1 Tax=Glaciihabitans tibetensis TaxID=1266600 RepID=A0A2T0VB27_9MICO|nr:alpha/beta hydrolase [Glaciihabitans tibetensis]PRY67399.1 acetyl esterase/lipase [Glaciihabitans tibetensis]
MRPRIRRGLRPALGASGLVTVLVLATALVLSGCALTGSESETVSPTGTLSPILLEYPTIDVVEDVQYGTADGVPLLLDVCLPEDDSDTASSTSSPTASPPPVASALKPRAAIVSIHGGSWAHGDKSNVNWRSVCQWLASEGYVAVSLNYRLAPASTYPAQIRDVREAVRWLREDEQVEQYSIDPTLIGAFGGSAGGNLAALLGTTGTGALDSGARVAAVAELSGPSDITEEGRELGGLVPEFEQLELDYLGCETLVNCPTSRAASPLYQVDSSDPPFFVGHSIDERIPVEQSEAFVEELRDAGVDTTFVTVEGTRHSIAMLDEEMRDRIAEFFAKELATEAVGIVP